MDNIWEKALAILKTEVNEQVFTAWFLPIQQASADDNALVLEVPNKFFENWIREKYISLIQTAAQEISKKPLSIKFKVATAPLATNKTGRSSLSPVGPVVQNIMNSGGHGAQGTISPGTRKQADRDPSSGWLKSVFNPPRQTPEARAQSLGFNPNYTFDNFVVGASNRFAHAASLAVCERLAKVYNPLFLYGGVGLGKTHLMQAMGYQVLRTQPKLRVLYISSEEFTNQLIGAIRTRTTPKFRNMYRTVDILLIDDVQFIAGKESTQEEFFHTFNALHDSHKQIVLCSDRSPQKIKGLEERLMSRFAWGLVADVQAPDFETRIAIMEKKGEAEDEKVSKEILYFLAENIKTNIREMEGALIRVVAYSKLTGQEMTVALAREVLRGMITQEEKKITIGLIQKTVAAFFNIQESDMKTKKRTRSIAYPRQVAMYISRDLTDYSLPDIGNFFGGRDHTTVLHACDKISRELAEEGKTKDFMGKLVLLIKK